jgi:hypothetical protein
MANKGLTLADMKPADYSVLSKYTEEDAKNSGYPSLKVMGLEYDLSRIAGEWRNTKTDALVQEYKNVLYEMILYGYDVTTLPIQDQLPSEWMPELPPEFVQVAIKSAYKS